MTGGGDGQEFSKSFHNSNDNGFNDSHGLLYFSGKRKGSFLKNGPKKEADRFDSAS